MSFDFTESQTLAIENRGGSILVSAAAGSGKTRVLTERLIRIVTDPEQPVDIDRFLVITYTRAAAAELRSRILEELTARAASHPEDRRLRRQQNLCCAARIGTIHSFCTEVIRDNCHRLGISPAFKVMEEDRAEAMKSALVSRLLDRRYETVLEDTSFRLLSDTVGAGRDDARLEKAVLSLYEKLRSHPYPEDWAARQKQTMAAEGVRDVIDTVWGRELLTAAQSDIRWWADRMDAAIEELTALNDKLTEKYLPIFSDEAAALHRLDAAFSDGWDAAGNVLAGMNFETLRAPQKYEDPETKDRLKSVRDGEKAAVLALRSSFAETSEDQLADQRAVAPAMAALLDLALDFDREYTREKTRRGFLDFSDLEHYAARLLVDKATCRPTEIAAEYADRFYEIMVDEYQDVNAVQEMIFRAVSRQERNLFLVGDVKQSIYRFRLADPTLFLEKYRTFRSPRDAGDGEPRRILLQENFRSRKSVLDAANLVFSNIMSRELGELDYDADAALKFGSSTYGDTPDTPAELCIVDALDAGGEEDEETPEKCEQEAYYIAGRIRDMLQNGTPVQNRDGTVRPCRPEDFVLLLRSPGANGAVFHRALAEANIPVQSQQGTGFFQSLEITIVVNLLSLIDNPRADIPLISVLRSPAFGLSADELSEIRACDRSGDFYTALCTAADSSEKCASFLAMLEHWRALSADLPLDTLVWRVCSETGLFAICTAMTDGDTRRRNLLRLFEYARSFRETGFRSVSRFVTYLRRLAEKGAEPEFADDGCAVRIMSIHKSKGLEFPFVFLCDLAHQFNKMDLRESVLTHTELGLGPKRTDTDRGIEYPTLSRRAIEHRITTEMLSEEMRVLYVGMTRAKERLIMTCVWKDAAQKLEKLRTGLLSPVPPAMLRSASSFSQWLAMAAMANESILPIRVVRDPADKVDETSSDDAPTPVADCTALREKLDFVYPFAGSIELPGKLTATELKRFAAQEDSSESVSVLPLRHRSEFRRVDLGKRQSLSAAAQGSAAHAFLQHLDFSKTDSIPALRSELQRVAASGHLTREEAEAVNLRSVEKLFASPLGKKMVNATELRREFRFTLLANAAEYFDGAAADDRLLLQGIVDCFFVENGEVTVVDYKTDRITAEEVPARAEQYRGQLETYAAALRRILGLPVTHCVLWFLHPGEAFSL